MYVIRSKKFSSFSYHARIFLRPGILCYQKMLLSLVFSRYDGFTHFNIYLELTFHLDMLSYKFLDFVVVESRHDIEPPGLL